MWIAVLADHQPGRPWIGSGRGDGTFACFMGASREAVLAKATEMLAQLQRAGTLSSVDRLPYRVLLGRLDTEINSRTVYEEVALQVARPPIDNAETE